MSGIFTARGNLNVTSHNIANAAMPGFSRQLTLQRAARPLNLYNGRGLYGTGSEVYGIIQMRDVYLDRKYWSQKAILGEYQTKNSHLSFLENIFNDLNDAGLRTAFTEFFDRCQDLTTNAPDATYRTNVITSAETLAQLIRNNAEALMKQQRDINFEITGIIDRINSIGTQISSLNRQIYQYELDGQNANDLRDQRALLVDTLSEYVNVHVEERDFGSENIPFDKRFTVMINGYEFVNHFQTQQLVCVPRDQQMPMVSSAGVPILDTDGNQRYENAIMIDGKKYPSAEKRNEMDVPGLYDIYFKGTASQFDIYSPVLQGTLKGLIDIRDGNNHDPETLTPGTLALLNDKKISAGSSYKGIPFYMQKLNILVRVFARAINEGLNVDGEKIRDVIGHVDGYDFNRENTGLYFFTGKNLAHGLNDPDAPPLSFYDYKQLNALNFVVNQKLLDDPYLLATSSTAAVGESNNEVTHGFAKINTYPSLFKEGKLIDFLIGMSDHLAIDRMQARRFDESYTEITMMTDNQRLSVMGVDINEEMMNLVKYNQLFVACSRLVNVIDQCYDTLINRLGNF